MKKKENKIDGRILDKLNYDEWTIYGYLPLDKASRKNKSYLESVTGFSERKIKEVVRSLRNKGIPVASQVTNGGGYWIELDKKEFGIWVAQQKIEVEGYIKNLNKMIEIYKSMEGEDSNELFV